ncbi:MAG: DUF2382 domain-containing protein [Cyanobacteria bacterium P01_G01_bin.49]
MALVKIKDYDPDYKNNILAGNDLKGYEVHASRHNRDEDKVGSVHDILVDKLGHFRYLVVDTGFWIFGKKVLCPIGNCSLDYANQRVYTLNLTKEQVENLPEYHDDMVVDFDYEEKVRGVYRSPKYQASPYDRSTYNYDRDPDLYSTQQDKHGTIKLYEERLLADKTRQKVGEVAVGKTVTTETARASVPVESEQVIVERKTPANAGQPVPSGTANFREGEVARMDIYEETANIRKETFVSEEVTVKKAVDRDTVTAEETLRRQELDIDTEGNPTMKRSNPNSTINRNR